MNPNGLALQQLQSLNITLLLIHEPKAKSQTLKVTKDCGDRGRVWNRLCSKNEQLENQLLNSNYGSQSATNVIFHIIKDTKYQRGILYEVKICANTQTK